jgi:hypothetical protein
MVWPLVIIASAGLAILAMLGGIGSPVRPVVAFWFLLLCPGMAFMWLFDLEDWYTELALALALSLTLDVIVSETMVLARIWSPTWALAVLAVVSTAGAVFQIRAVSGRHQGVPETS